jgi:uncharacterized membrane protein YgcG
MKKKTYTVSQFKKFALYATIAAAVTIGTVSCSNEIEVDKYDNVETTLVEYEAGKFKIDNEVTIKDTVSRTIVKYLDGTEKELGHEDIKKMFKDKDPLEGYEGASTPPEYYDSHASEMWMLLYWSNYGLHLGRPHTMPVHRGFYTTAGYSRATVTQAAVVKSRTTTRVSRTSSKAPVSSRSSYGSSSSRGYSGGSSRGGSFGG